MLTSISVTARNNPYKCGIVIRSSALVSSLGGSSTISISRRVTGSSAWEMIYISTVSSVSDLSFEFLDITSLSGIIYDYQIEYGSEFGTINRVRCWFEALFVGDFEQQFIAQSNYKTETKKNMAVEYVTTLAGKYPYRVSNSNLCYTTGTSAGLFLELGSDGKTLMPDTYHTFSNKVMDFLCNGECKVLKTHDGQGWYVSIDKEPAKVYSDFMGMNAIQFAWTEIGEMPVSGLAV